MNIFERFMFRLSLFFMLLWVFTVFNSYAFKHDTPYWLAAITSIVIHTFVYFLPLPKEKEQ